MKASSHLRDVEKMRSSRVPPVRLVSHACMALLCFMFVSTSIVAAEQSPQSLELSRPVRSWEFLPVVGTRAGLFGNESGEMEGWVYPLKIFRGFHLTFHVDGHAVPAESLARTLIVHPESATLVYAGDDFSVRETFFVPVHEPGAVILLDVETEQPLEIEAGFVGDFQLEWPAASEGHFSTGTNRNTHSYLVRSAKSSSPWLDRPPARAHDSHIKRTILRTMKILCVSA